MFEQGCALICEEVAPRAALPCTCGGEAPEGGGLGEALVAGVGREVLLLLTGDNAWKA